MAQKIENLYRIFCSLIRDSEGYKNSDEKGKEKTDKFLNSETGGIYFLSNLYGKIPEGIIIQNYMERSGANKIINNLEKTLISIVERGISMVPNNSSN